MAVRNTKSYENNFCKFPRCGLLLFTIGLFRRMYEGVDSKPGTSNPTTDNTTDHFVVIVGMGTDATGNFFRFYDNATNMENKGTHDENKLYYDSGTGTISGKSHTGYAISRSYMHDYIVTMIRKSKPI